MRKVQPDLSNNSRSSYSNACCTEQLPFFSRADFLYRY